MKLSRRVRDLPGVLIQDLARYRRALERSGSGFRSDPAGWISVRNRSEQLIQEPGLPGLRCDWTWGSFLHAPEVLPSLSRRLMRSALQEWPIGFADQPRFSPAPKLSFVFAHAGAERLPQLRRTLRSLFAQVDVDCEFVVVDESHVPLLPQMPLGVTYHHLAREDRGAPWHKTLAYNVGARLAKGSILVFHDGDICAPTEYAREVVDAIERRGFAAVSLQRLLFYLDEKATRKAEADDGFGSATTPESVFQNWKGGTIAIRREAFFEIGGFDEGFVGWGGEDAEFFDRCCEVGHCTSGYLPFVHLWHAPQPSKSGLQRDENIDFFRRRMEIPRRERIARLKDRS